MQADFDDFLDSQLHQGHLDSQGVFTIDLMKARHKLAVNSLESPFHFILKFVQVANMLRAETLNLRATRSETEIILEVDDSLSRSWGPESAFLALSGQVDDEGPNARHLTTSLLACLDQRQTSCRWERWNDQECSRLTLRDGNTMELEQVDPPGLARHGLRLTVCHQNRWNPWKVSERVTGIRKLLETRCGYSPTPLTFNGRLIQGVHTADLNAHLSDFGGSQFNVAIGAFQDAHRSAAASSVLYVLAESGPQLAIRRPSLEEYRTFGGNLNVWERALSTRNTLRPNGQSVPAWMLQYRRGQENIAMLGRPEKELCRAVLVMNLHGIGNMEPLRLNIVRHGVLCLANPTLGDEFETDAFRGCTLVLADDELSTDLSGLQIRRDERLKETLAEALQYLRAGEEYFEQCARVLTFA